MGHGWKHQTKNGDARFFANCIFQINWTPVIAKNKIHFKKAITFLSNPKISILRFMSKHKISKSRNYKKTSENRGNGKEISKLICNIEHASKYFCLIICPTRECCAGGMKNAIHKIHERIGRITSATGVFFLTKRVFQTMEIFSRELLQK